MRHETETAIKAASAAIQIADSREGADDVSSKGGIDLVTATDVKIEDVIRNILIDVFPHYSIVGEERGGSPSDDNPYWLVDPICAPVPMPRMYRYTVPILPWLKRNRHRRCYCPGQEWRGDVRRKR